ncbi:hypothetical protein HanXRQr2_Chr02g0062611 [Helianthus annuus]|uniref:Uncharacterized protein n=1 Tax=Helianthus annuus TaxID=4232 RepID=A0A251VF72_HELAN|nr:hypothetical protein HanXRQr2_Chr02g0062611 [Helianthus annuus]KAJ0604568.1 hypothetical protein HanHA300_Chr02g0051551 [Helianthus annuus]KAJ0618578.1 hypothetical protein HanHA89_Chr02g0054981 [Helianthus annuus]KAJ0777029.1 hypothetical protein HanLR1_Chr02g0052581 [Helianthus annuus]
MFDLNDGGILIYLSKGMKFRKWIRETNFVFIQPNTTNKFWCYSLILDDFRMDSILDISQNDFMWIT